MENKKRLKQISKSILIVGAAGMAVTGCGSQGSEKKTADPAASKEPFKLSIMSVMYSEPPNPEGEVQKKLEQMTNTKLQLTWVPSSTYTEKANISVASGEMPMAMLIQNNKDANIVSAARSGMFWEIGPYLKDFPNLSKMNKDVFNNVAVDGKIYGLYRSRDLATTGITYRKDWLDNLGLQEPKTIDEFTNMLKAFANNDPDKNGKNDTFGITEEKGLSSLGFIANVMGAPNGWGEQDGKLVPDFMTPEYTDALKLYKKLYDDKLINQDFAVLNNQQKRDLFKQSKAGIYIANIADAPDLNSGVTKAVPQAKVNIMDVMKGPKGEKTIAGTGYNGMYVFPKTSLKNEADLKKALGFFDKLVDQDVFDLLGWGLEGRHYKLENGKRVFIDQKLHDTEVGSSFLSLPPAGARTPGIETPLEARKSQVVPQWAKFAVMNPTLALTSETQNTKGVELGTLINDSKTKFILGKIDEAGWKKAIEDWRKAGGDKIIQEYNDGYAKLKK